jgi:putative DNA methylase
VPRKRTRRIRDRRLKNRRRPTSILSRIDWKNVEQTVIHEQRNRERHAPVISVYRWWARRPHALMGSILDAAAKIKSGKHLVVSDPFSGGGTVAVESARRGIPVYAQDLFPWPTNGLAVSLSKTSPQKFKNLSMDLLKALDPLRSAFQRPDGRELTHVLRVRVGACPGCTRDVYLFPNPLISLSSRGTKEERALFGCRSCGNVAEGSKNNQMIDCPACKSALSAIETKHGHISCPHCSHIGRAMDFGKGKPAWQPVAVQEVAMVDGRRRAEVRRPQADDPLGSPFASRSFPKLRKPIPDGVETHRLLEAGFKTWGDLYTDRQAAVLLSALRWIECVDAPVACKDRLALAVIGAAEMPAYLSRWDRNYLKAYEGIANHRYAHTTLVVESNLLAPIGRGTLPHRLASARKALEWMLAEGGPEVKTACLKPRSRRLKPKKGVTIATGSSIRQRLKDGVVDLVLTDPPYFDDVQYGELARLLHFWLALYKEIPEIDERQEAVPNRSRGNDADFYVRTIGKCLSESKRTLASRGRLILTFHNKKMAAWKALCRALHEAGFIIRAVAAVRVENDSDHTKRQGRGLLHDLVLECERKKGNSHGRVVTLPAASAPARDLLAMGAAMGKALKAGTPNSLPLFYETELLRYSVGEGGIR